MNVAAPVFTSALIILCPAGQDGASLQAFVLQVDGLLVGILIMKDELVGALLLYGSIGSPQKSKLYSSLLDNID